MSGLIIKIVEPGMEDFSDYLGSVLFEHGVSVEPVTEAQAFRISSNIRVETLDGKDPSQAAMYHALYQGDEAPVDFGEVHEEIVEQKAPVEFDFTRESLEATADAGGINALRVIANQYGVKGNSIVGIVNALMALTGEVSE